MGPEHRRLQIGISSPQNLPTTVLKEFADPSWVSLGEHRDHTPRHRSGFHRLVRNVSGEIRERFQAIDPNAPTRQDFLDRIVVQPFWWTKTGKLPFGDGELGFIFSEHFVEHLFLDEAFALLVECRRVLRAGGVLRVSVPDADLRTYEPPEPVAFDAGSGRSARLGKGTWNHPDVHKTRWNVYALSFIMEQAGLRPIPLVYCDRDARFVEDWPAERDPRYPEAADWEAVTSRRTLMRGRSLILDAVRAG